MNGTYLIQYFTIFKSRVEWATAKTESAAKSAVTKRLSNYCDGARIYKADLSTMTLTLVEERGTVETHVEGQQPLF